ncbi:hypothetical protein ACFL2B_01885 [Patescibacteria group bacterium]
MKEFNIDGYQFEKGQWELIVFPDIQTADQAVSALENDGTVIFCVNNLINYFRKEKSLGPTKILARRNLIEAFDAGKCIFYYSKTPKTIGDNFQFLEGAYAIGLKPDAICFNYGTHVNTLKHVYEQLMDDENFLVQTLINFPTINKGQKIYMHLHAELAEPMLFYIGTE